MKMLMLAGVIAAALLLAACAPAHYQAGRLAHDVLVYQKEKECRALPGSERQQCLERTDGRYSESREQYDELREELQREREQEGEAQPDLDSGDRM